MALFEANLSPYLTLVDGAAPAVPAAGNQRVYIDTADKLLKWKDSAGTVRLATGQPLGLTGAVSATRYVGGTASVAPTTGTFAIGDFVVTQAGGIYVCTVAGTPGTWVAVSGGGGSVATDAIWDAAGDLVQGTGANTAAKLSAGTAGMMLKSAGAAAANLWAYPPGYELNYVEITSDVIALASTHTTEATAITVVTAGAVSFDGSTIVRIEFGATYIQVSDTAILRFWLYDGASSIGEMGLISTASGLTIRAPGFMTRRMTPSNASHTYSIRASTDAAANGVISAGAGGAGNPMPAFIRIVRV